MSTDRFNQQIPRPVASRPGEVPPWTTGNGPINPTVAQVAAVLDAVESHGDAAFSVLVPLVEHADGLSLIFIRRASTLTRDPGHIAFPGGRRDAGEPLLSTALRETEEEIGLDRGLITVIGALAPRARAADSVLVAPFVGLVNGDPRFVPNPGEVDAIIEIPLAALYAGGTAWVEMWQREGDERESAVHFFADHALLGNDVLWGLSARILWDLLNRIWVAVGVE